jgi:hypothetical protein
MKSTIIGMAVALGVALPSGPAAAWASANRFGGSTEHVPGATEHSNAFGGSSAHAYGEGTEHTNMYGGSSAHAWGGGTEHTNVYGGSTYGAYGAGAVHTTSYGANRLSPARLPGAPGLRALPSARSPCRTTRPVATTALAQPLPALWSEWPPVRLSPRQTPPRPVPMRTLRVTLPAASTPRRLTPLV